MAAYAERRQTFTPASERELLRRAQLGDKQAFADLLGQYRGYIVGVARKCGVPAGDCEDLAQRVLIKVWTSIAGFKRDSMLKTWLYVITRRCSLDILREQGRDQQLQANWHQLAGNTSSDPLQIVLDRLDANAAAAALDVNPLLKIIVTMLDDGVDVKEIAEKVHLSMSSVYRLITQARSIAQAAIAEGQEKTS